jgi:hypothetical protein
MPVVYRFRVTFEDYDEVSRDIEIKNLQTFEDLHNTIQSSIGFDNSKAASFFMSTDHWLKGQEIATEERTTKTGEKIPSMKDCRLCDFIADPHQKIIYISDYDANWSFLIELAKIIPSTDPGRNYPVCVKSTGEAPKQYVTIPLSKSALSPEDSLASLLMVGSEIDDEEDDETDDIKDDLMEESEEGVEMDEIEGMSEEGEDDDSEKEEGEEESYSDEDQQDDY